MGRAGRRLDGDKPCCPPDDGEQARAAEVLPWDRDELALYRTIVPQMVLWLPDEEAARWRFDVEAELDRLTA